MGFRIDTQTTWNQALFDASDAYMAVAREHGLDVLGIVLYESAQASNVDTALAAFESRGDVARAFVFKVDDYDDWGISNLRLRRADCGHPTRRRARRGGHRLAPKSAAL
jgi:hypothetical protein